MPATSPRPPGSCAAARCADSLASSAVHQRSTSSSTLVCGRGALIRSLGQCTLDVYRANLTDATTMQAAVVAHAQAPSSATLQTAQTAWHAAMDRWQEAELLQMGPLAAADTPGGLALRDQIYAWPNVNRCLIDQQLIAKTYEAATFAAGRTG